MRWVLLFQWNNWIRRVRNYEQRRFFRGEEFFCEVFGMKEKLFLERFRRRRRNNRALFLYRKIVQRTFFEKSSSSNTSTGEEWRNNFLFQILNRWNTNIYIITRNVFFHVCFATYYSLLKINLNAVQRNFGRNHDQLYHYTLIKRYYRYRNSLR